MIEQNLKSLSRWYLFLGLGPWCTALWLFALRFGVHPATISSGHFGGPTQVAMGPGTFFAIFIPHLLAVGTLCFGVGHLLGFGEPSIAKRNFQLAIQLMLSGLLHISSSGLIILLGPGWVWIKVFTLTWFFLSYWLVTWRILKSLA